MRKLLVFVLVVAACSGGSGLEDAHEACGAGAWATIGDGGDSLIFDGPGEEESDFARSTDYMSCILTEAGVPDYVRSRMGSTTALAGQQSASWEGMEASWSYHPDSGFDLTLHAL